ncbi:MFS transporter [Streptomyces termitum]|uniref:MFS transporter n=1 Tax=Streptomyces termitum TaxID=67368 RepID=A0A918T627_9ACTN|nr:MFS transporter [Streptomyces termitum]GHA98322.1 MFS transporter [Streptomyces termitum]
MPDTAAPAQEGFLQRRLGLPDMRGNRKFVNAAVIDSVGSGLILAFILVYFARTTDYSLPAIGGALTLARFLAVPTAMVVGPLIDRFGARMVALVGNVVSAVGYTGFLISDDLWQIAVVAWLTQIGGAAYWTSSSGLVVLAADPERRPRWFALLHMLRNSGLGIGGALGALLVGYDGTTGLHILVVANSVSYLGAAVLLGLWHPPAAPAPAARKEEEAKDAEPKAKVGYGTVLRDRRYMLLVGINVNFVFAALVLSLLVAVFVTEGLGQAAWIGGALLVLNSVQVAATQTLVNRRLERYRPIRVIAAGSLVNALAFGLFALLGLVPGWVAVVGLFVAMVLYNLAETVATPFSEDLSVSLAPEHLRGRYLAVYQLSWTFGQTVAPLLLTVLLDLGSSWPWLFLMALALLAVPALLLLERMSPKPAEEPAAGAPVPAGAAA